MLFEHLRNLWGCEFILIKLHSSHIQTLCSLESLLNLRLHSQDVYFALLASWRLLPESCWRKGIILTLNCEVVTGIDETGGVPIGCLFRLMGKVLVVLEWLEVQLIYSFFRILVYSVRVKTHTQVYLILLQSLCLRNPLWEVESSIFCSDWPLNAFLL